jgi:Ca2+/Na+ antiporter
MLKRVLAWIALIFLLLIITNILFIHVYVTESATIFLLYVLILYFGRKRKHIAEGTGDEEMDSQLEKPEDSENGNNTDKQERLE